MHDADPGRYALVQAFVDADGDGYGRDGDQYRPDDTSTVGSSDLDCADFGEASASAPLGDCVDSDETIHPGVAETAGDGVDQDCDGGETFYADGDGDQHRPDDTSTVASSDPDCADFGDALATAPTDDCDDVRDFVFPGAPETVGDEIDADCDGTELCNDDADGDGARTGGAACVPGASTDGCDGADNDCDAACTKPAGRVADATDCQDRDATAYALIMRFPDEDADGYGTGTAVESARASLRRSATRAWTPTATTRDPRRTRPRPSCRMTESTKTATAPTS